MLKIRLVVCFVLFVMVLQVGAQSNKQKKKGVLGKGPNDFPELVQPDIIGAPKLGKPKLIMGEFMPVMSEGMGWAAPAVFDWDGDGKKDLLIGEFGSGLENEGRSVGNFIRVYKNVGSSEVPKFLDQFSYARYASYPHDLSPNGTPISVHTWCCMGFTPQFVDLDNDGLEDLISGQYNPGEVTWFRNTGNGFQTGIKLAQEGDPGAKKDSRLPTTDPNSWLYWNYSSASFGDFDEDGDHDLITGGAILRISENTGGKTTPRFGPRKPLLDINGDKLKVYYPTTEEVEKYPNTFTGTGTLAVPLVVDWDEDGVLDLMVTSSYVSKGKNHAAVTFFRGVKTQEGHRFEPGKALFSTKDGSKAFPGSWLRIYVTDWNNDGVNDLLIGASVATLDGGKFNHELSWQWESETGISKQNQAYTQDFYKKRYVEPSKQWYEETRLKLGLSVKEMEEKYGKVEALFPKGYKEDDPYMTLAHQGYVYVMLGKMEN